MSGAAPSPDLPADLRCLAEDLSTYQPLRPGAERILTERYALILSPERGPRGAVVQRLRLSEDAAELPAVLAEVRGILRGKGRAGAAWEVGDSARPRDLATRLRALGLAPHPQIPETKGMVLRGAPRRAAGRPAVAVRRVTTLDDYRRVKRIFWEVFGFQPEGSAAEVEARLREEFAREGDGALCRTYLAAVPGLGDVAAAAGMLCREAGALLCCGGATLPEARGRGAYQALLQARWEDAQAAGLPYLVIQAGPMSQPILQRAGFQTLAQVTVLYDQGPY